MEKLSVWESLKEEGRDQYGERALAGTPLTLLLTMQVMRPV